MLANKSRSGGALGALVLAAAVLAFSLAIIARSAAGESNSAAGKTSGAAVLVDFNCAKYARTFVYLFWPNGRAGRGVPSEFTPPSRFPGHTPDPQVSHPHVSVWLPDDSYANSNLRILSSAGDDEYYANYRLCRPGPGSPVDTKIANRVTRTRATAVSCTFRSRHGSVGVKVASTTDAFAGTMIGHDKRRVFLKARLPAADSRLTYNTKFCERISLPTG